MSLRITISSWPDDVLLERKEAAIFLACRPGLLAEWACQGIGPPFIKKGRWIRYRLGDLRAWVAQHYRAA